MQERKPLIPKSKFNINSVKEWRTTVERIKSEGLIPKIYPLLTGLQYIDAFIAVKFGIPNLDMEKVQNAINEYRWKISKYIEGLYVMEPEGNWERKMDEVDKFISDFIHWDEYINPGKQGFIGDYKAITVTPISIFDKIGSYFTSFNNIHISEEDIHYMKSKQELIDVEIERIKEEGIIPKLYNTGCINGFILYHKGMFLGTKKQIDIDLPCIKFIQEKGIHINSHNVRNLGKDFVLWDEYMHPGMKGKVEKYYPI